MNIQYRRLQPVDSGIYREIRLESLKNFPDSFCTTYDEQEAIKCLDFERYIVQEDPGKFITGAFYKDFLTGICGFKRQEMSRQRHRGEIVQMYVRPEYQGQKTGQRLLQETIRAAFSLSGVEQIELGVLTAGIAANRMYEKAGFREYGLQKNFIKTADGMVDQRFMVLYLKEYSG